MLNVNELVKECTRFLDIRNIDRWWSTGIPSETQMNPYQPMQGSPSGGGKKSGQGDGRFSGGGDTGDNMNNMLQHMNRTGGESSSAESAGASVKGY